jgi:hypothetical protein
LKLTAPDGKFAKAEPFKLWLARIGKERIDEIENPELAMDRMGHAVLY